MTNTDDDQERREALKTLIGFVLVIVIWCACFGLAVAFADSLDERAWTEGASSMWPLPRVSGIIMAIVSAVLSYGYVGISQNRHRRGYIIQYRWVEEYLISLDLMDRKDILDYHRSYGWSTYAGLGFSTVFIIVILLITNKDDIADLEQTQKFALFLGLVLLILSTIMLSMTDMFHTNMLTPLIPSDVRFDLIHWIIVFGSLAIAFQVCALGIMLSMIDPWLSIVSGLSAMLLMVFYTKIRKFHVNTLAIELSRGGKKMTAEQRDKIENTNIKHLLEEQNETEMKRLLAEIEQYNRDKRQRTDAPKPRDAVEEA